MTRRNARLAIDGGPPLLPDGPPGWPLADPAVRDALMAAYDDGSWGRYEGAQLEQLSERLRTLHDVDHVTLCASGTVAVELALRGLGVGQGDEVLLAGYDYPGNFRAIEIVGARPVLVDVDPNTWSLDVGSVESARSARTRAIIVSHLHGGIAPMR
ncbi:MAG: DegT/DnrJ/EryC1/StrS family aminotransferase, partial [Pirellulales bacterium]